MKKLALILFLSMTAVAFAANDFSGDADVRVLYNFESGALTTDSSGNGYTLSASANPPDEDAVNYKQGSCSANYANGDDETHYITDTTLGLTGSFTVCMWFRPNSLAYYMHLSGLGVSGGTETNFLVSFKGTSTDTITTFIGYNAGASTEEHAHASALSADTWYHVAFSFNNSTKAWLVRIHDEASTVGSDVDLTATNNINIEASEFCIGNFYGSSSDLSASLDEYVLFSRALNTTEIDAIWAGTFTSGSTPATTGTTGAIQRRLR